MLQITDHTLLPEGRMDGVIVAVAHNVFKKMNLENIMKKFMNDAPVLIDARGTFDGGGAKRKGFYYKTL
ncbi:MAG: hypothetical protein KAV25_09875 [Methanophagales archaeon]|nr:hypothetical protein [Methanophagales archaeon]